jgi:DNA-directed RNA polymerase subunit beta'
MTRKITVDNPGDTDILVGSTVDVGDFNDENAALQARIDAGERDLCLASGSRVLLGITKASIQTNSFLSAASFQETTKVLTEAAIKGKVDHLLGLKENVLIGKLIPAGTGMERYRSVELEKVEPEAEETAEETENA